jgi:hypothetical protein
MDYMLADLVAAGELTQAQADTFSSVHDRLAEAGLMQWLRDWRGEFRQSCFPVC